MLMVHSLALGPYGLKRGFTCPHCSYLITNVSGAPGGRTSLADANALTNTARTAHISICARCEWTLIIAEGKVSAIPEEAEGEILTLHSVCEQLRETRNRLRIDKATGKIRVPPMEEQ